VPVQIHLTFSDFKQAGRRLVCRFCTRVADDGDSEETKRQNVETNACPDKFAA